MTSTKPTPESAKPRLYIVTTRYQVYVPDVSDADPRWATVWIVREEGLNVGAKEIDAANSKENVK
jgi:hypothetical protein